MCPQSEQQTRVETHLQDALAAAERTQTRYHIREALQLSELEGN